MCGVAESLESQFLGGRGGSLRPHQDGAFNVRLLRCHVTETLESHAGRAFVQEGERVAVAGGQHDDIHRRAWIAEGREMGVRWEAPRSMSLGAAPGLHCEARAA